MNAPVLISLMGDYVVGIPSAVLLMFLTPFRLSGFYVGLIGAHCAKAIMLLEICRLSDYSIYTQPCSQSDKWPAHMFTVVYKYRCSNVKSTSISAFHSKLFKSKFPQQIPQYISSEQIVFSVHCVQLAALCLFYAFTWLRPLPSERPTLAGPIADAEGQDQYGAAGGGGGTVSVNDVGPGPGAGGSSRRTYGSDWRSNIIADEN